MSFDFDKIWMVVYLIDEPFSVIFLLKLDIIKVGSAILKVVQS